MNKNLSIKCGTEILPSISSKGNISLTIPFEEEFKNIPHIITSLNVGNYSLNSRIDSIDKTGFSMTIYNIDSSIMYTGNDRQLNWLAISV